MQSNPASHRDPPPPATERTAAPTVPRTEAMRLPYWYNSSSLQGPEAGNPLSHTEPNGWAFLGAGRSAQVFRAEATGEQPSGPATAIKVFNSGDRVASALQLLTTGTPYSPYRWNENAIACAHLRRELLSVLVPFWFKDESDFGLEVARSLGYSFSSSRRAYVLHTEFIEGRAPVLSHPFSQSQDAEITLLQRAMHGLQEKLKLAGFEGTLWQAGYGNPVAANNFLLRKDSHPRRPVFSWIDLESGLTPVPVSPKFLGFYLPWAIGRLQPLFDDVNTQTLSRYLKAPATREKLVTFLGEERAYQKLLDQLNQLGRHQAQWKRLGYFDSAVHSATKVEGLTPQKAHWYLDNPHYWYARLLGRGIMGIANYLSRRAVPDALRAIVRGTKLWCQGVAISCSSTQRQRFLQGYLEKRINHWQVRGNLQAERAEQLKQEARTLTTKSHLYDFIGHIGLYLSATPLKLGALAAGAMGLVSLPTAGLLYVSIAPCARVAYAAAHWVAAPNRLGHLTAALFAAVPTVGNFSYLLPSVFERHRYSPLGMFALYDALATLGERLPVVGGKGTLTQYWFNRLGNRLRDRALQKQTVQPELPL